MYAAAAKTGLTGVSVNYRLMPDEVEFILNDSEVNAIFVREQFADIVVELRNQIPSLEHCVFVADKPMDKPDFMLDYNELIEKSSNAEPEIEVLPDDNLFLAYTSGTTGKPKGVLSTNGRFVEGMVVNHTLNQLRYMTKDDVYFAVTPLTHMAQGFVWPFMVRGARTVILPNFDFEPFFKGIEENKVTHTVLAPTLVIMLLQSEFLKKYDFSSLKSIWYAASPMPVPVAKAATEVFGPILEQMYGLTENTMTCTCLYKEDHAWKGGSAGRLMMNMEVCIVDDDDNKLATDEVGEICIRGNGIMKEYWKNPVATAETLRGGWLHTSDVGRIDEDGFLWVVDRKKDMIISGGFNVYPAEVEDCIAGHPAVVMSCVVAMKDEKWVEAVTASVVLKDGETATEDEIITFCKDRIAHFKAPKKVFFVDELPISATGKVIRRLVRDKIGGISIGGG